MGHVEAKGLEVTSPVDSGNPARAWGGPRRRSVGWGGTLERVQRVVPGRGRPNERPSRGLVHWPPIRAGNQGVPRRQACLWAGVNLLDPKVVPLC